MTARWAWARTEIRAHRRGLLAVAVLIGLMAATAMTGLAGARRTASSYDRLRTVTRAATASATVDPGDRERLERIGRLPEVEAKGTGTIYPAFVDLESEFDLAVFSSSDGNVGRTIDLGKIIEGRLPRPDQVDEVAVNPAAAAQLHTGAGRSIRLGTLTPAQREHIEESFSGKLEGPALHLRVTGVVRFPEDLFADDANAHLFATPAFDRAYRSRIGAYGAFGEYLLKDGTSFASFAKQARPLLGSNGFATLVDPDTERSAGVRDSLRFLSTGLVLVGLAALVVALVAGSQALARQLGLATIDQPTLSALGLTRAGRTGALMLVALPVAVVAGLVAIAASVAASPLTPINLARQAEPDPGVAFDRLVHPLGAAVTIALVLFASLVAAWSIAARTAVGTATGRTRPSIGTRVAAGLRLGPGATAGVRMALERGAARAAVPARSALIAAVVAVAGVTSALTFSSSLDRLDDTPARYGKPWDLMPDAGEQDVAKMASHQDVGEFGILLETSIVQAGREVSGYAMQPLKGSPGFTILNGRPPASDGEVVLGRDVLERSGAAVGSTIPFTAGDEQERTFRIVGTFVGPAGSSEGIAASVLFTPKGLDAVARGDLGKQAVLLWRKGVDPSTAQRRFDKAFPVAVSAYATPRRPGEVVNLTRVRSLAPVVGGILAVVGAAALLHALTTSTRRRRQELAVLRAVGFVRRQVTGAVTTQSTTIALVGVLAGIPIGVAVGRWAWIFTADAVGVANDPRVPIAAAAAVVAAALVVAVVLGAPVGIRTSRVRPAVALRAE
ncbi:MAG: putative transport system permease protein [Actinomycetota bacterium]